MKKHLFFTAFFACSSASLFAQNEQDALRYSMLTSGSTARSLSIGGAAGSLGADFSATSVNPAGLAQYFQSELTITPALRMNNANANYFSNATSDSKTQFTINNLGMVFTKPAGDRNSGWESISFGIGFNRMGDFNDNTTYQGINKNSSFSEVFAEAAQRNNNTQESYGPYGYLGYQGYVLTNDYKSIPYQNIIRNGGSLNQQKITNSKGGANEITLSLAGNYDQKLLIGATIGITTYNFKRVTDFIEKDNTGNINNGFNYFTFRESLSTTGAGINAKLGLIYAPIPILRFGVAVHTPTSAALTDMADYNIVSDMESGKIYNVTPKTIYKYDYTITTPMRAVVSGTVLFGTKGFLTADYEYVPYQTMRLIFKNKSVSDEINNAIKKNYTGASNVRVGAEFRFKPAFSARLGYAMYGNPYAQAMSDWGSMRTDISAGIGYKFANKVFLDFAYVYSQSKYKEYPYTVPGVPAYAADITNTKGMAALTVGVKF